ncbi:MAG: prohibitin family protein [Anaerolineae bacterium]
MKKLNLTRSVGLVALVIVGLIVIFSSYTVIGPGHRGVVVMLGRVEQTSLPEGFHLVLPPVVRKVVQIDVRTKKFEVQVEAASSDLQIMQVTGVLNYHLDPESVGRLYQQVGVSFEDIIIVPAMQEAIKAATAQYRVDHILVQRAVIKGVIEDTLTERLGHNNIIVDQFSLADVSFSDEFDKAIERKQVAEQAALQKQYELQAAEKDVEISLALAEGQKKAAVIAAEGRAEARKLEANAEAEALRLIAAQLRNNPELIRYEWASKLSPGVSTVLLPSDQSIILDAGSLVE